jgi:hypothetical protein
MVHGPLALREQQGGNVVENFLSGCKGLVGHRLSPDVFVRFQ